MSGTGTLSGLIPGVVRQRSVLLVTPDPDLRERVSGSLVALRWSVSAVAGGAEAMAYLAATAPEAIVVDHWLPDLDAVEFLEHALALSPASDFLHMDGSACASGSRSPRRNEVLHALREAQGELRSSTGRSEVTRPAQVGGTTLTGVPAEGSAQTQTEERREKRSGSPTVTAVVDVLRLPWTGQLPTDARTRAVEIFPAERLEIEMHLPDMVGGSAAMVELSRLVRLVAPHNATVLIQGETGTGKELVAKAVHRLSQRASKPFVVLNCAAIPEHLLEAELFGHTRGAFTGAVTSRVGRIEAAHGGTLFLDEVGEMPLALQAKMLRFLESGELQRVGENDTSRVDVRIIAATHQPLLANTDEKLFRLDLYHRLAVFPLEVPPLRSRREDIPMLVEHLLRKAAEDAPRKTIAHEALVVLHEYSWSGNVRELCHVMQRAVIMAGDAPVIATEHLRMREQPREP